MSRIRDGRYDAVKGLAIILMVLGHTRLVQGLHDFIYLFHVPIFFLVVGWFYRTPNDWPGLFLNIRKRIVRLWWPFVFWSGSWIVLHNFLIRVNVYSVDHFDSSIWARQGVLRVWELDEVLRQLAYVPSMCGGAIGIAVPYWFLIALFFASVGYLVLDIVVTRLRMPRLTTLTFLSVAGVLIGRYADWRLIAFFTERMIGRQIMTAMFLIHLGVLLRQLDLDTMRLRFRWRMVIGVTCLPLLLIMSQFGTQELVDNQFPSVVFLVVSSLAGWYFLLSVADLCGGFVGAAVSYIGRRSLVILLLHFPAFWLLSACGVYCIGLPAWRAATPVTAFSGFWWSVAYVVAGVGVPLALDLAYDKSVAYLKRWSISR